MEKNPRRKKTDPTTPPTGSQRKSRKRAAAKRKAAEEARNAAPSEIRPAKVSRTDEKSPDKCLLVEKVAPSLNGRKSLSKSVDKEELVRRAVAHATAAAE